MVNPIESLKNLKSSLTQLPTKYRLWTSIGILTALLIALPVTLIGLTTGSFELRKRAATAEVTPTPTPTPMPTPICKIGVNFFSVYNSCPDGFRNARYMCYDGVKGILGDPTSCESSEVWRKMADAACKGHSSCPSPTATPTPIACIIEGKTMPVYPGYQCCSGLTAISTAKLDASGNCPTNPPIGASVCAKCGDKICGSGENKCNCPGDCFSPKPTPSPTVKPTPTPTAKPTPVPPRKCPGTCLPNFICRLLGGKCTSGYTCPSSRGIFSNCCCLRPSK